MVVRNAENKTRICELFFYLSEHADIYSHVIYIQHGEQELRGSECDTVQMARQRQQVKSIIHYLLKDYNRKFYH